MTNIKLMSIDQYVDVSSITNYHTYHLKEDPERRLHRIHLSSRDSARTPMQWDTSENAGFSKVKPWFYVNPNYNKVNVAKEEEDKESILWFYRNCLALRKGSETLIYGDYTEYFPKDKNIFMYERSLGKESYLIICSFSRLPVRAHKPEKFKGHKGELVLCNYEGESKLLHKKGLLRPFETRVYRYNME
jgi:oligo-1,6-glucosidase